MEYVSAMTGDLNTTVTASVYLLDENYQTPTDGELLNVVTYTYPYAGYHRMPLDSWLILPEGSLVSIVVEETVETSDGLQYALVNSTNSGPASAAFSTAKIPEYSIGIVDPGESFFGLDEDAWLDWTEIIDLVNEVQQDDGYTAWDNLPVKGYVYPLNSVLEFQALDQCVYTDNGQAQICAGDPGDY